MHPYFHSRRLSFRFALAGITYALRTQPNTRIHLALTFLAFSLSLWLHISILEWALVVFATGIVWLAELFNTAIEAMTDLLSPEYHQAAGVAKDVAAGSVLIAAITALLVGLLVIGPPLWHRFFSLGSN